MTVSIALRQWSAIDENDQNCKGASTKPSVTALSDRTIRCNKTRDLAVRSFGSSKQIQRGKVKFDGEMCIKSFLTEN